MKRRDAASLVLVALLAAACQREARQRTVSQETDDSTPRYGGTVIRRLEAPINTLNPVLVGSRYDTYVHRYLFTPLVDLSSDLQPSPGLAEKWEIAPNNLEYTFHLNRNATFSDKTPVKASDVLFTLRKIVDPHSDAFAMNSYFDTIDLTRSRAVDDHTLFLVFREPLASQLMAFTNLLILPEHVYSKGDFKKDHNETAVGSGPYTLLRQVTGSELLLQRRDDYWARKPFIEKVHFKVIQSGITAWNAARVGQIDETMVQTETWIRERLNPQSQQRLQFITYYGLAYNCIIWNTRRAQLAEARVRRALAMCLNLQSIITGIYHGTARVMSGHFLPEQPGYNATVKPIEYNLEEAKKTFTSLGWLDTNADGVLDKDSQPLAFELMIPAGSAQASSVAQIYQADLQRVGVKLNISVVDFAAAQQRLMNGNFDATYISWDLDADPDPYSLFHSSQFPPRGSNFAFYANPEADRLIDAARREFDAGKRATLYQQLHAVLAEDQPYAWIVQPSVKWVLNKRVRNAKVGHGYGLFLWYPGEFDWWLADAPAVAARTGT